MSSVSTQANQFLSVATPLGPDAFLLERIEGSEAISEPFSYRLDLLAGGGSPVDFSAILGGSVTVSILLDDGSTRSINGVVEGLTESAQVGGVEGDATYIRYRASVVPSFRLLDRTRRSRIFQQLAVPDILRQVLQGLTLNLRLQGQYQPRESCVQYDESDFAFASRLMEDEGIFYYVLHDPGAHTMVLADNPDGHPSVPGNPTVRYDPVAGALADIHSCETLLPPMPHGVGVVVTGSQTVTINGLPACRLGDTLVESIGPPNTIALGEPTVVIGG